MVPIIRALALVVLMASSAWPATRYVSQTGSDAVDCSGGENISTPLRTLDKVVDCTVAGDIIYIREGTWNERLNFQDKGKTGTSLAWISVYGYPGETVTLRYSDAGGYGAIKARGSRGYFAFANLIIDGSNYTGTETIWGIRDGNHHFILQNVEIKNTKASALYIGADDVQVTNSYFHDTVSATCVSGTRYYGIYIHHGARITIQGVTSTQNPGGGFQFYPGPLTDVTIARNHIYNNGSCPGTDHGGLTLSSDPTGTGGGSITNVLIYDNVIHHNGQAGYGGAGTGGNTGGTGHGMRLGYSFPTGSMSGVKIFNNVVYLNESGTAKPAQGITIQPGANNIEVRNNIVLDNENGQISNGGTGNTITHNICKSADSCGTTGKVTVTALTDVLVSSSDFRLKQGTNVARDAGIAVSTRPNYVGSGVDIGAHEQGILSSASVNDGIDLTFSVTTPGILPSTGLTGITVSCLGCTGTPVVSSASVQAGANTVVHLTITGISVAGTCRVSIGTTNMTDSLLIGGPQGTAQFVNSVTNASVTGNCANTGATPTPSGATAFYKLNEGAGTSANDETVNNNDGTVSTGVTWPASYQGTGVQIPTDVTYRHVDTLLGASTNMATAAGAACVLVTPDIANSQKVVFSSGSNGTNQRFYFGWATVGGQLQWGIGIGTSGFTTGSEFPVTATLTSVCIRWASGTATLIVNGVAGVLDGKSIKTGMAFTTTATTFRFGNDGTFTTNNGGFTIDEPVIWTSSVSLATVQAYHTDRFPLLGASACYKQVTHQVQMTHLVSGVPANYQLLGATTVYIIDGGAAMVVVQFDCVGSAGGAISVVPYYSTSIGGSFTLPVPSNLGAGGIAAYGDVNDSFLNAGSVSGNLSGALTPNAGSTVLSSGASPVMTLPQNNSQVMRWGFKFSTGLVDQVRCIKWKQDNGQDLAGGYTPTNGICFQFTSIAAGVR